MTPPIDDLHVYLRNITPDERTSLSVLASLISPQARVLDLGCGSGALGQHLVQTKGCSVDGVTLNEAEAAHAAPYYSRVVVDNLETCDLLATFAGQRYDAIVCADVLEHLSRPERVLTACRELLTPSGQLLISVPNAGYCGLIAELMQGEFRYREEGLLDRTHLRFFTRQSLTRFLGEQRWGIDCVEAICRELPDSEFNVAFDSLPPAAARHLLSSPDALTYQFITVARPVDNVQTALSATALSGPAQAQAQARFTAQLYLGYAGQYAEDCKLTATGVIGQVRQTLRIALPPHSTPLTRLRLDPADRPGFLHLYRITLRRPDGGLVWQWASNTDPRSLLVETPHSQIVWQAPMPAASSASLLLLAGDDPWFELPIAPDTLATGTQHGAHLEIELGWPMSADYLALSSTVGNLEAQIAHMEAALSKAQLEQVHASSALRAAAQHIEHLTPAHQQYVQLQLQHQQLQALLESIQNSTVFKATRPIVRAKMRLDRLLGRTPPPSLPALEEVAASAAESIAAPPLTPTPDIAATPQALAPTPAPASTVDIIIPVYQGLADTQLCINSVLASTNGTPHRVIVINDASPDPELSAWLRDTAAQEPRITLLENSSNLGFVGTVNRGMALASDHDILLLNSDTEVANDWLDRLHSAAYRHDNVATVTPFSNNATICSYPRFCSENPLPAGYDTAQLDALCAQTHAGAVLDVPTGIGFCMYIRRDCLTQVGLFDVENFGKGYGEENDFCQRAAKAGWRNLHALDTFVRHTGGVSFGASKSLREQAAQATLQRLHPDYETEVHAFVAADPAKPCRNALDFARLRTAHLPRVLTVLHNAGGGTWRHTEELASHLAGKVITLLLIPLADHFVRLQWNAPNEALSQTYHWLTQSAELLDVLRDIGICHVHYHHLLGVNPEIMLIPERLGITYDFTAHDYYTACPQIALVDINHNYCGEQGLAQCTACLAQRPAPTGETIEDWRLRHRLFLRNARYLLAPSRDVVQRMQRYFPSANLRFAPHLDLSTDTVLPQPQPRRLSADEHLRVLVIGAVNEVKGADMLEAVALHAAHNSAPMEFHLVGYAHRQLQTQPHASLTVHGAYADSDLPRLLERLRPDVVWFPARWPETYSYTLSACLLAGVPIMAPNLGAFPERLSQRRWTWIKPWDTSALAWLDIFETLRSQHFVTGQEPPLAPEFTFASPDADQARWNYDRDYLQNLGGLNASSATPTSAPHP